MKTKTLPEPLIRLRKNLLIALPATSKTLLIALLTKSLKAVWKAAMMVLLMKLPVKAIFRITAKMEENKMKPGLLI